MPRFYDCAECGLAARDRLCMSCKVRCGEARFGLGAYGIHMIEKRERFRRAVAAGKVEGLIICRRCGERIAEAEQEVCDECVDEVSRERARRDALEAWRRGDG